MLLLDRDLYESVMINNEIEVKVLRIKRGQVRLGFTAPKNMTILRSEIFNKCSNLKSEGEANVDGSEQSNTDR